MARPRPVPPKRCAVEASACVNSSKILVCCSGVMPIPESATATSIQSPPLRTRRARSLTSPCLVNLQALLKRLSRICRSRMGSTIRVPRFSRASTISRFLFCSASWRAARVLEREHRLGRERLQELDGILTKFARLLAPDHKRAEDLVCADQRHNEARSITTLHRDFSQRTWRLVTDIGGLLRLLVPGRLPDRI